MVLQTAILGAALWLLLLGGLEWLSGLLGIDWSRAERSRRVILSICFGVVYVRMAFTMLYLLKRAMGWEEALTVPLAFALYYLGFSLFAGPVTRAIGVIEIAGIVLFVIGSLTNTVSELLRHRWKRNQANQRRLYTGGLFRYSMHINYFGDILWVIGLALITANPWASIVPVVLFCFFAFFNAPQLDRHLAAKYGEEFEAYRKKTSRIIPFVY